MEKKDKNSKKSKFTLATAILLFAIYILVKKAEIGFFEI
jgi:hypothetical protein